MPPQKHGFTLIELLIVVAIIAILAAIAVPNFLEAQVRSKVSRAMADMRNVALALESYRVDENRYPNYGHPNDYVPPTGRPHLFLPIRMTSPVAYLSSIPEDIFHNPYSFPGPAAITPTYYYMRNFNGIYMGRNFNGPSGSSHYQSVYGRLNMAIEWTFWSHGPDNNDDHGVIAYDPTNGTISQGDIIRFGP